MPDMHIALNGWFWDQPNTGSGQYIRRLVSAFRKLAPDMPLTLILPPHNSDDTAPDGVTVLKAGGPGGKFGKVWFEQRTFPRLAGSSGATIAHVPYWGPPLSSPIKLVTTVLDVIPLALPEYNDGFFTKLYTSLVATAARGSAHILTISEAAKADIVTYIEAVPEMITPTHLAADETFHPRIGADRDASVRDKYDLPDRFVLYLGGFDRRKNVNDLLLAWTYVQQSEGDNIMLILAGREPNWGSSPVFPDLRKYSADLAITESMRWLGYVDEADKPSLYRLADVFVYPSLYEGFGLPLIEAMASGTPVVASQTPVFEEISGDGAYLVDNPRAMAGAIIALLLQQPLRESMVNQGLAQATRFNWRKTAKATLDVYERVMALDG